MIRKTFFNFIVLNFKARSCFAVAAFSLLSACGGGDPLPESYSRSLPLNDTGISHCASDSQSDIDCASNDFPGQDAAGGRDYWQAQGLLMKEGAGDAGFDFIKLNQQGQALANQALPWDAGGNEASSQQWSCALDAQTGLVWEVKSDNADHPRYGGSTFAWFQPDDAYNGGEPGSQTGGDCNLNSCNSAAYIAYVNEQNLCGYSDWRLPKVSEFLSLGHFGRGDPSIDVTTFPNNLGLRHWSAETYQKIPILAWYMYFSDGSVSFTGKGDPSFLRLVRGGEAL